MQLKLYSVKDQKAEIYHPPYVKSTHGEAERFFTSAVNNKDTTLNMYPKDFDLYYLGTFDDNTGKMDLEDTPKHVVSAIQVLKQDS